MQRCRGYQYGKRSFKRGRENKKRFGGTRGRGVDASCICGSREGKGKARQGKVRGGGRVYPVEGVCVCLFGMRASGIM
jgi:hypothetical protein